MLLLIRLGYVTEKHIFEKACNFRVPKKVKKEEDTTSAAGSISTKASQNPSSKSASRKQSEEDKDGFYTSLMEENATAKKALKKQLKKLTHIKENPNFEITELNTTMVRAVKDTVQDIWASVLSQKCPHCGKKPYNVKLDSNTKFIIETKNAKEKVAKVLNTKKGYDGMDSEEEEEEDEENTKKEYEKATKGKETQQIFLNPLEIKEHIKYLWEN